MKFKRDLHESLYLVGAISHQIFGFKLLSN